MAFQPPAQGPVKPGRSLLKLIAIAAVVIIALPLPAYGLFLAAILYDMWMHGSVRWN